VKLRVLGTCSPYPLPGRACPGYLLEVGGRLILLDCGSGVAQRFLKYADYDRLSAVVVSHFHGDHMSDLLVVRYAAEAYLAAGRRSGPLPVYAPPEPAAEYALLPFRRSYRMIPAIPGEEVDLGGGVTLSFRRTVHPVPCNAVAVAHDGRRLVYSADTALNDDIVAFTADADLFLCEATLQEDMAAARCFGHLTAADAGALAGRAGVRRLLLTHFSPGLDLDVTYREARANFAGLLELAEEEREYVI
jgi:ribonuclease BN (tRNA processing enzyme)